MANIATALKAEIARVARKEIRVETESMKKAISSYRTEIAALKKRSQALEMALRKVTKTSAKAAPIESGEDVGQRKVRFSAKGLATQRARLGLSAHDCGRLVGASGQSIYNWESESARPREAQLAKLAALRGIGKRTAAQRLEKLAAANAKTRRKTK